MGKIHKKITAKKNNTLKKFQSVESKKAPEPVGLYPHARIHLDLLFLSGVGPRKKGSPKIPGVTLSDTGEILSYDIEAQCHSVFENVKNILEDSGSCWENLIDVTVFLTNMKDDFKTYNKIYAQYFEKIQPRPCRTTVGISALPTPIAIELKCIALLTKNTKSPKKKLKKNKG